MGRRLGVCTVYLPHGFFPPLKKTSCTLSCAKWLGRCSAVCFSDPPRSLFPSSSCLPPCSCVPLLPPRRSMHQTWSMFPAPSARQASGLSRVGNGHFDLGIKGFLSEGNRFGPKKSKKKWSSEFGGVKGNAVKSYVLLGEEATWSLSHRPPVSRR